ncbi:MAG: hypothetical protein V7K88_26090 [Nostoc sp.]|uniref:hypothetical protein n=1 Tax=Nostoc sp. TaxID=1180 RepID=UPI002FF5A5FC
MKNATRGILFLGIGHWALGIDYFSLISLILPCPQYSLVKDFFLLFLLYETLRECVLLYETLRDGGTLREAALRLH